MSALRVSAFRVRGPYLVFLVPNLVQPAQKYYLYIYIDIYLYLFVYLFIYFYVCITSRWLT